MPRSKSAKPSDAVDLSQQLSKPRPSVIKKSSDSEDASAPAISDGGPPKPYVKSIDTFGSNRINSVILRETLGKQLDEWIKEGLNADPKSALLEEKLANEIRNKFGFAFAKFSVVQFFEPDDSAIHITLDVVEKKDVASRMPFESAPTQTFSDPDGLIAAWNDYEQTALDLVQAGELQPETEKCPAFHCPFGHKHPKLKKYEAIFVNGVKKDADKLIAIQSRDKRPEWRAAATYLLPYLTDGNKVVSLMVGRIRDPDSTVRNNALRVLGDIAEFHPEYLIPVKPVLEALHFPRTSDRAKAVYVAFVLSLNNESARNEILKTAVPDLLALLGAKQPDERGFAHDILRKISGQEYADTDVQAWRNWYNRLKKSRGISAQ